jgi:hypothetical protein
MNIFPLKSGIRKVTARFGSQYQPTYSKAMEVRDDIRSQFESRRPVWPYKKIDIRDNEGIPFIQIQVKDQAQQNRFISRMRQTEGFREQYQYRGVDLQFKVCEPHVKSNIEFA